MAFIQVNIPSSPTLNEILIAELEILGFDSYQEEEAMLLAFVDESLLNLVSLKVVFEKYGISSFEQSVLEDKNWNEEWEKNFEPIWIEDKCCIRASFHPKPENHVLDILIEPKMSFGTGHHQTTFLISKWLLENDCQGKNVLDVGCGTGILGIIASKKNAQNVLGFDIDKWSVENTKENIEMNHIHNMSVYLADSEEFDKINEAKKYEIILANITKNIIIEDIFFYKKWLSASGKILLSGFFEKDISAIESKLKEHQIKISNTFILDQWAMIEAKF